MRKLIGVIDQGTSGTKFFLFDQQGHVVHSSFKEHRWYCPKEGWVEQDALEIYHNTLSLVEEAFAAKSLCQSDLVALGITNQRETTVLWEKKTGIPLANAISWQDSRTADLVNEFSKTPAGLYRYHRKTGLPLATYFSGMKLLWLLEHVPEARKKASSGDLLFGTIDSFLLWKFSGGPHGGKHLTDVTNASRTLLFNIHTMQWDQEILEELTIPSVLMPEVVPNDAILAEGKIGCLKGITLAGLIGDQQAALIGQNCLRLGEGKCTYGTGAFLLVNTAYRPIFSDAGLITTIGYKLRNGIISYALEGSSASAGSAVHWLKQLLKLKDDQELETLALEASDNGGIYFVPAFCGLFAPYWDPFARAAFFGLTLKTQACHLARAVLEATAFQVRDLFEGIQKACGMKMQELKVDGGMVKNERFMQFQADILNRKILAPENSETTAMGAAFVTGLAGGLFNDFEELGQWWKKKKEWLPTLSSLERQKELRYWKKALRKAAKWIQKTTG
jgi:glycerol kinase